MPWIALHEGEKKAPRQVPTKTDVECPVCGDTMRVWSRSTDGKARHFKHIDGMSISSGGGGSSCESVAESDVHKKWKSLAADALEQAFAGNVAECRMEKTLDAPASEKDSRDGDAVVLFEKRDPVLGAGMVAEVQHKNHSKDIEATTADYIKQGYSVVWLRKDDFAKDRCRLTEIDFRKRARDAVWPDLAPSLSEWERYEYDHARMLPWRDEWDFGKDTNNLITVSNAEETSRNDRDIVTRHRASTV